MSRRLPPLNALRVFEVAARHLSFTTAARELNVTNAAVSRQIKQLEEALGVVLFERHNNRLALTAAGQLYLPRVNDTFRALRESTDLLLSVSAATIRIGVRQGFCQRWLLPRLARFQALQPNIHLDIDTEFERDYQQHDLIVDYRPALAPDYKVRHLFSTALYPVCSPLLAQRLATVGDLQAVPLLHDRPMQGMPEYPDWQAWLQAAGAAGLANPQGATFSSSLMCMQAAEEGLGVALGQHVLISAALQGGRLLAALPQHAPLQLPYYLCYSHSVEERPGVRVFIDWLSSEAAQTATGLH